MKFCVQAELKFDTEAKRAAMVSYAKDLIKDRPIWKERIDEVQVSSGVDIMADGNPTMNLMVRFDIENDMRDIFQKVKDRLQTVSGVHGTVKIHRCEHDTPPFRPCVIDKEFVI